MSSGAIVGSSPLVVVVSKGADLGYVAQRPEFARGETVRGYVEGGMVRARQALEQLEQTAERMSEAGGTELDRLIADRREDL